jgi:hypothetical protein
MPWNAGAVASPANVAGVGRYAMDITRGVTIFGDLGRIVETLRALDVPMSEVEFVPSCEWALYVKPGVVSGERSRVLRDGFQVAAGRC